MTPTFRTGDYLRVEKCADSDIASGDVIVFNARKKQKQIIVHRVVKVLKGFGVQTRGDNNPYPDSQQVTFEEVLGRVVCVTRGNRVFPVANGRRGLTRAGFRWVLLRMRTIAFRLFRPLYNKVYRSGLLKKIMHSYLRPRVIAFKRSGGTEYYLIVGHRRLAGKKLNDASVWQIKPLFRPFIDETRLPL